MEKLLLSIITCSILLTFNPSKAQEYVVFKSNGKSTNIVNNTVKPLKKGNVITKGDVFLTENDTLLLLDKKGIFYQLDNDKKYSFIEIISYEKQQSEEGFSKKYFSYVWEQMKSKQQTSNNTGNVYREGRLNILTSPMDSISIYNDEVKFTWKENTKQEYSYFFLRNTSNNTMSIIKVKGTSLSLFTDNKLLVKGDSYSWGVAYKKYPSFDRVKFNTLYFLNQEQFKQSKKEYIAVFSELKKMGYNNSEIKQFVCEYFNLCEN